MPSRRHRNSRNQHRGGTEAQQGCIATGTSAEAPPCWPASGTPLGSCAARHLQIEVGEDHVPSVVQVPEILECPIACDVMNDPVLTCDGQVFERKEIETWLKNSTRSPTTGLTLPCKDLVPLPSLQQALETCLRASPEFKRQHALQISVERTLYEELQKTQDHLMSSQCHASDPSRRLAEKDDEIANLRQRLRIAENVITALKCSSAPMSTNVMLEAQHHATSSMELLVDSLPNLTSQGLQSEVAVQGTWKGVLPQLNRAQRSFVSSGIAAMPVEGEQPEESLRRVRSMAAAGNLQALVNILGACVQHGTRIEELACVGKALRAAAYSGHASVVQYLLELRACLDAPAADDDASIQSSSDSGSLQSSARIGVLAQAAWSGHLSVVRLLLASVAPQDQIASGIQAARAGKHHVVMQCLESHSVLHQQDVPKLIDYPCQNFIQASQAGNLQGVLDKLSQSDQNHDFREAACIAAMNGQIGVIRLLLESRACLTSTEFPLTALQGAAFGGNLEIVKYLLAASHSLDPEALIVASYQGFIDVVNLLLSRRCSVNSTSKYEGSTKGLSALMVSAMSGNMDVTRALLQHRAALTTTADGKNALSLALGNGFIENAKLVAKCMPSQHWAACHVYIPDGIDFPLETDAKRVLAARLPALRFPVGTQVCCAVSCRERQMGTVVRNWFHQARWPQNHIAPYNIRLDDGSFIHAPLDEDCFIHSVTEFCCQSDTLGMPSTYHIRVASPCLEQKMCTGVYQKTSGNNHVWKHTKADRFLYHGDDSRYYIGDAESLEEEYKADGYVRSIPTCSTCPPHVRVGSWLRFDEEADWVGDPGIVVSEDEAVLIGTT